MALDFRREYLIRLPLPLAQLYCRARNAKDGRGRHDSCFYLFESLIKIAGMPMVACYHEELRHGGEHVEALDRLLVQLSLPSLGQFVGILRETARYYGERDDAETHPLGHVWGQLNEKRKDQAGMLELFRRIKNGPQGKKAGDKSCTILQLIDALVTYRNAVIGHGAGRGQSFYEDEMGPLMFPAVNDILEEGVWDMLGPAGSQLVLLEQASEGDDGRYEVEVRELIGLQSERSAPAFLDPEIGADFQPDRMAIIWPGRETPLMLDPLLLYQESEISEDVLILNRDRNRKQVEFLSYATGETTRNKAMSPAMNSFIQLVAPPKPKEEEKPKDEKPADDDKAKSAEAEDEDDDDIQFDYELLAELGRGGMGIVYLARQQSLGRLVALKMLPPEVKNDEVAVLRFRREMRALGHCEHPNIIKVIACGQMPTGEPYYAMEYVPGTDLEQLWIESAEHADVSVADLTSANWSGAVTTASTKMRTQTAERTKAGIASASGVGPGEQPPEGGVQANVPSIEDVDILPPVPEFKAPDDDKGGWSVRVAKMMRDAAHAVQYVHEQGFVHRDIKPGNLMLTPDGERVVLMDFGLAKQDNQVSEASASGGFLGTLRYSSPEMLEAASKKVGPAVDIRGLGITMWELLTRKKLFADCEDEAQLARAVAEQDVPLLRTVDPAFDRDLEAIVARATERSVADRIESAADLAMYLDLYIDGKPIPIRTPGLGELIWRWVKAHKAIVTTAAVSLATVIITVTVSFILITRSRNAERAAKVEATQRFRDARDAIDTSLTGVSEALKHFPGVQTARTRLLQKAAEDYQRFAEEKSDRPELRAESGKSFIRLGNVRTLLTEWDEAEKAYRSAESLFEGLIAEGSGNVDFKTELANSRIKLGDVFRQTGRFDESETILATAGNDLDDLLKRQPDHEEVLNTKGVALVSRAELLRRTNRFDEAEVALVDARATFEQLADSTTDPKYRYAVARTIKSAGLIQSGRGEHEQAVATIDEAIAVYQDLVDADEENPDYLEGLASARVTKANAMRTLGRTVDEIRAYETAIEDYEVLVDALPDIPYYRFNLAVAQTNLGQVLHGLGQNPDAKEFLLAALTELIDLTANNPTVPRYLEQEANSGTTLAKVLQELNETELSQRWFERIYEHYTELTDGYPDIPRYREGFAIGTSNYGRLLHQLGDGDTSKTAFESAVGTFQELLEEAPDDPYYIDGLAWAWTYYGDLLHAAGQADEADNAFANAISLRERLNEQPEHIRRLAWLLTTCSKPDRRDVPRAVELATQARDADADNARILNTLGVAQYRAGQWDAAIESLDNARQQRIVPSAHDGFFLAMALWQRNTDTDRETATELFNQTVESMTASQPGHVELSGILDEAAELLGVELTAEPEAPAEEPEAN